MSIRHIRIDQSRQHQITFHALNESNLCPFRLLFLRVHFHIIRNPYISRRRCCCWLGNRSIEWFRVYISHYYESGIYAPAFAIPAHMPPTSFADHLSFCRIDDKLDGTGPFTWLHPRSIKSMRRNFFIFPTTKFWSFRCEMSLSPFNFFNDCFKMVSSLQVKVIQSSDKIIIEQKNSSESSSSSPPPSALYASQHQLELRVCNRHVRTIRTIHSPNERTQ